MKSIDRLKTISMNHKQSLPWYRPAWVKKADVMCAWSPIGTADLAASYINQADPGTYDLVPYGTSTPGFSSTSGWLFSSDANKCLITNAPLLLTDQTSLVITYTHITSTDASMCGAYEDTSYFTHWAARVYTNTTQHMSGDIANAGWTLEEDVRGWGCLGMSSAGYYLGSSNSYSGESEEFTEYNPYNSLFSLGGKYNSGLGITELLSGVLVSVSIYKKKFTIQQLQSLVFYTLMEI